MATKKKAKRTPAKKPAKKTAKSKAKTIAKSAPAKKAAAATKSGLSLGEICPSITANDLEKSMEWYTNVVGFAVEERWERDGKLAGVSLRAGASTFMLGQDDWQKGRDRKKGDGFRLYCMTTGNVDAYAARITAKGGVLDQPPTDQPWGMRDFSLTDPDGFKITIGKELKKKR